MPFGLCKNFSPLAANGNPMAQHLQDVAPGRITHEELPSISLPSKKKQNRRIPVPRSLAKSSTIEIHSKRNDSKLVVFEKKISSIS